MTQDLHMPDNKSLIKFPCDYKLKAMGHNTKEFIDFVFETIKKFVPAVKRESIEVKDSKGKRFISVNITFYATCIGQIHNIYGDLKKSPLCLMTL